MKEINTLSEAREEIKRLKLKLAQAPLSEQENLSQELLSLTLQKVGMGRRLDALSAKMRSAAEKVTRLGVGIGEKKP